MATILILCLVCLNIGVAVPQNKTNSLGYYLNKCVTLPVEGASKTRPSPEPGLECPSFRKRSCCYVNAVANILENHVWNEMITYMHCPQKPRLSPECERLTFEQSCFYACSPNLGPWIYRYLHFDALDNAPLCASQCNKWWDACKEEYTCHRNWITDMDWNGLNTCKEGSVCRKYTEFYNSSTDFCSTVFNGAYKVVPDSEPCMVFTFDTSKPNPNTAVALEAAKKLVSQEANGKVN
ncbi:folate receptor gamma isoform X2 [Lingula anatina]|uniref:Folate receptor gamma isoform X2 n=1 Tax=Lingula anatina TaxID=7574 RepID=A0A1S3JFL1_LINAN|nr:folate receptor gamma isoform X2 [Lingula anatina]|eukprot:XP_013408679.1 folate receptor gamma isoform X2 [Lingula anatina]